jgi:3-oxoacyl-[acyl-carrier protein] reductase
MHLPEQVIAITGGGRGLGLAIACELADHGAKIALIDVEQAILQSGLDALRARGATECRGFLCNVASEAEVEATFKAIGEQFGQLNGLINNAGILRDGRLIKVNERGELLDKMSLAQWQAVIDVNLTGVFLAGREAAATMAATASRGVINNISSVSRAGNFGQTNYSAAKAGVVAMTTAWAKELAPLGIRSCAIAPGFIATEMVASMNQAALDKMASMIPAGRLGAPEEIASMARFIFENDYLNGRVFEVDGGIRL